MRVIPFRRAVLSLGAVGHPIRLLGNADPVAVQLPVTVEVLISSDRILAIGKTLEDDGGFSVLRSRRERLHRLAQEVIAAGKNYGADHPLAIHRAIDRD